MISVTTVLVKTILVTTVLVKTILVTILVATVLVKSILVATVSSHQRHSAQQLLNCRFLTRIWHQRHSAQVVWRLRLCIIEYRKHALRSSLPTKDENLPVYLA